MLNASTRDRMHGATSALVLVVCLAACLLAASPLRAAGNDSVAESARGAEAGRSTEPSRGTELVLRALSLLGVNYKFGGNSPDTGLDCSGLVRHVFREAVGVVLPRRAEEMSRAGETIESSQLLPGDLVFFNTLRRTFSHVGIYIGNGQFVHAPSTGGGVRIEQLSKQYWTQRFNGARRLVAGGLGIETPTVRTARAASAGSASTPAGLPPAGMMPSPTTLPLTGAAIPRIPGADLGAPNQLYIN